MKMSKLEQMHAQMLARKLEKQKGATMIEYALVAAGIVGVAAIFIGTGTGESATGITGVINTLLGKVTEAVDPA